MVTGKIDLQGRKILCIMPRFFGYEKILVAHLEGRGANVVFLDERPGNSTLAKISLRLRLPFSRSKINRYFDDAIVKLGGKKFDDVLIVSPECCRHALVSKLKQAFPDARFILYMWDSFKNKMRDNIPGFISLFDRALTFDDEDAERYGLACRPLFYSAAPMSPNPGGESFAFSFIGTIHSDRYRVLKVLIEAADRSGLKYFVYPYLPSRLHYWLFRLTKREFKGTRPGSFEYRPMPYPEVLEVFKASVAVLDVEHSGQRGLTMRTMEVIGSGKKLITTNARIRKYSFFSDDRIQVLDRKAGTLDLAFFGKPTPALPPQAQYECSLTGWVDCLFQ